MLITSINNPLIKSYVSLLEKKNRDITRKFLVEGEHLVEEANKYNVLESIIILEGNDLDYNVDKVYVSSNVMKKLTSLKSLPKVIGIVKMNSSDTIKTDKVLILDGVQDPGNLGTIIRSSCAFSFNTIIMSDDCVDIYNEKVIRATQGNIFNVNVIRGDLCKIIDSLKANNYTIYGSIVTGNKLISDIDFDKKCAIIMGNEGNGIRKNILDKCDSLFTIKINENVESLNVAVACSIILYEIGGK